MDLESVIYQAIIGTLETRDSDGKVVGNGHLLARKLAKIAKDAVIKNRWRISDLEHEVFSMR